MAGNVSEWCNDWHDSYYYTRSPYSNPTGPESGVKRVLRGGYFGSGVTGCRTTFRNSMGDPKYGSNYIGFRVVKDSP